MTTATIENLDYLRTELATLRSEIELDHEEIRQTTAKLVAKMKRRDEIMLTLARKMYTIQTEGLD